MTTLHPTQIYKSFREGKIDKETLIKSLIHIIENESDELLREETLRILEDLKINNEAIFKLLENIFISDYNSKMKIRAGKWLIRDFPKKCISVIKSLDRGTYFPVLLFDLIWSLKNPIFDDYNEELYLRIEDIIQEHVNEGIVYEDAVVLVLMEELFRSKLEKISQDEDTKKILKYRDMWFHYKVNKEGYILGFYFMPHSDPYDFDFIPESLSQLKYLEEFCMINASLEVIPETIGKLKHLKKLVFNTNNINSIPESIGNLALLEELDLCQNHIRTIPNSIGMLKSLKWLFLCENEIKEIPNSIGHLTSLEKLALSSNQIQILPNSMSNLIHLNELFLEYNYLTMIPKWFENFKNLKKLNLSNSQIENISNSLKLSRCLEYLNLGNNNIKQIPK